MAQGGCDPRQRHIGGDRRKIETVSEILRAGLKPFDVGIGHGPGEFPVGGRSRPRSEGLAGSLCRRRADRVEELEGAEQLGRDGDLVPALGAALQVSDPDRGGLAVDVAGKVGQGFGDPGASVGERESECGRV